MRRAPRSGETAKRRSDSPPKGPHSAEELAAFERALRGLSPQRQTTARALLSASSATSARRYVNWKCTVEPTAQPAA